MYSLCPAVYNLFPAIDATVQHPILQSLALTTKAPGFTAGCGHFGKLSGPSNEVFSVTSFTVAIISGQRHLSASYCMRPGYMRNWQQWQYFVAAEKLRFEDSVGL